MWKRLGKFTKNSYCILGLGFLVWILFFDSEDLITQYQLRRKLKKLEEEKGYYLEKIQEVKKDREELTSNEELLEKFAREKYYMKKPTEDLYIVIE
ncbi:MAG: septum formation initiator family protein [Bacteroidota bacterium]